MTTQVAGSGRGDDRHNTRHAPEIVVPTNRINVAFPFSRIETHEPSKELRELAEVVAKLASLTADLTPTQERRELLQRAQTLAQKLR
jgi:hypothetical protein